MPDRPVRLPPLAPAEWTDEVRDFLGAVMGPEAREKGTTFHMPLTFARHPELSRAIFEFSRKVQTCAGIAPTLREIVIMRVAWRNQTHYEWGQHHRTMRGLGMGDAHVQGIKAGPEAAIWTDAERAALRLVDELHDTREVSAQTWEALTSHFSTQQILDLLILIGQYEMLAGAFNAVGLRLEPEYSEFDLENS
jgi:alkylhydroperoxidase family enzyme